MQHKYVKPRVIQKPVVKKSSITKAEKNLDKLYENLSRYEKKQGAIRATEILKTPRRKLLNERNKMLLKLAKWRAIDEYFAAGWPKRKRVSSYPLTRKTATQMLVETTVDYTKRRMETPALQKQIKNIDKVVDRIRGLPKIKAKIIELERVGDIERRDRINENLTYWRKRLDKNWDELDRLAKSKKR